MTYNRQRCDPATTQRMNSRENNFCEDRTTGGLLPTGIDTNERIAYSLFYCDARTERIGGSDPNLVLNGEAYDFNVRGIVGECLPDCIQVRVISYPEPYSVATEVVRQIFNIDTRCAGNSLVTRTNYGAFRYREDFNVQCPVGKK